MLRHILFDVSFFENDSDRKNSEKRVLALLEALVWCNRLYLRQNPDTPWLYGSDIEYKLPEQFERAQMPEVSAVRQYLLDKKAPLTVMAAFKAMADQLGSGEHFREIPRILENGGGDCDNLAGWRVAELRERVGVPAKCQITSHKDGNRTIYHVIVRWPDGTSEDPSLLCGMGGWMRAADQAEEVRKLEERSADYIEGVASRCAQVLGVVQPPSNFGQGLQYTIPFQTDDAYEDWSPTRPQFLYDSPTYKSGPGHEGPMFNTLLRDPDDERDEIDGVKQVRVNPRFYGQHLYGGDRKRARRELRWNTSAAHPTRLAQRVGPTVSLTSKQLVEKMNELERQNGGRSTAVFQALRAALRRAA